MPERRDETPTSPETTRQLDAIASRIRRRSTRTTEIARLKAYEILTALGLSIDDPRAEQVALIVRGAAEQAIDAAHSALSQELAELGAERDRLLRRLELIRRSEER